ncbi:hypothetical protein POM88_029918 [Heracleum sosnowskyi]|uniref:RRM domain-containing protein n=1 Tax=Heracleum sosnowskyi TaxID=360622 RepID=A0AAD8MFA0_9APIA|nr:hypothetical protein POM88_029918 [Heracleum sosnowskyi]
MESEINVLDNRRDGDGARIQRGKLNEYGKIQNSNSTGIGKEDRSYFAKEYKGDQPLVEFIEAYADTIDEEILKRFRNGDQQAITDALNQIHWRTIKTTMINPSENKGAIQIQGKGKSYVEVTSQLSKDVKGKIMTKCGQILDIILPRKRDVNNKRIGFIKTTSELEASTIISNAKEQGGWGRRIMMTINGKRVEKNMTNKEAKRVNTVNLSTNEMKKGMEDETKIHKENDFGKDMFEFIEVEVDENVEKAFLRLWLDSQKWRKLLNLYKIR